jgi:hypothetical protein
MGAPGSPQGPGRPQGSPAPPSAGPPAEPATTVTRVRAGNLQAARPGRPFAAQLTAVVTDRAGAALPGARVTFRVTSGAAGFDAGARVATAAADAGGVATAPVLTAGADAGPVQVTAAVAGGTSPATYTLRVTAG